MRVRVVVVYEAGQDGFWIQRALAGHGYEVLVVDPASILVERRVPQSEDESAASSLLLHLVVMK